MRRFDFRWVPLVIAAGAFLGSALVSSVAVASDESPPIDEPVLVFEPTPSDVEAVDPADPAIIEVVDGVTPPDETAAPLDAVVAAPASDAPPMTEESDEGHEGGAGGQGNPYRMTFTVTWLDPNGTPIGFPGAGLPIDGGTLFELTAFSRTGKGMQTSATCTYPAGSDVLQCVFDNPGHGSGTDGLIVPARPTATYTVTVKWPPTDWTIDGANAGPYSARDLCPREEGAGHEGAGGHEGTGEDQGAGETGAGETGPGEDNGTGHQGTGEEGAGTEQGAGRGVSCEHPVVLRQIPTIIIPPFDLPGVPPAPPVDEPDVDALPPTVPAAPPVDEPEVDALPPVAAPPTTTPTDPATTVAPAATAPGSLPVTGGSAATILLIAALLLVIGSVTTGLTRRTR